jgi:predicted aldo/keto reductase-like oxidoreductase
MNNNAPLPRRALGKTGVEVTLFGLGGEGILRTYGEEKAAAKVISRALDQGVNYCDTAPAYAGSMDYYGATLGERRKDIFLASKTADRTRDGSLKILDASLKRLRTDRIDLWQLHDLRDMEEIDEIFGKGGAIEALQQAKAEKRVRFLGLTGHHDPKILLETMKRFRFDTVLVALNAADVHRASFIKTVLPEAVKQGMGVIAMKTCSQGALLGPDALTMDEAVGYALSLGGVSHAIIGCKTEREVDDNARIVRSFAPFPDTKMRELEVRTKAEHESYAYYKK